MKHMTTSLSLAISLAMGTLSIAGSASATASASSLNDDDSRSVVADVAGARFELQVPVLYYHHIVCPPSDATSPTYFECPAQFAAQLSYLHDQGWQTITVDQVADLMASQECPPAKRFVISIDDGALDGYTNAAPIMESFGMHGSYFVVSGIQGSARSGQISWDQLRDLLARGHAIGNHTETHANLKTATTDVLSEQIQGAQEIFGAELGLRPRTFAYPYGRYSDAAIAQVAATGFELAFTVHSGAKEASDSPFIAKRIAVASDESGEQVLAALAPFTEGCRPPTPDLSVAVASAGPLMGNNVY
jgi:peptidoglycan/xylan/chitin deacetylase (PgdA/CDA1 family)